MSRSRRVALASALVLGGTVGLWVLSGTQFLFAGASDAPKTGDPQVNSQLFQDGTWKQITTQGQLGQPVMKITGPGRGELTAHFSGALSLLVGAKEVVMEASWREEDNGVAFFLHSGEPETAYRRLLLTALEERTDFRIGERSASTLVLFRVTDDERFEWRKQPD
ncbi:MAG: hypothetical protein AAGG01_20410 [Planctomycetota bacterium]